MKKINVNNEACIGCGACVAIDPEHFAFNDEGLSHPITSENLESSELQNAIDSCPTCAISIIEETKDNNESEGEECSCECNECNCSSEENCGCHCNQKEKEEE